MALGFTTLNVQTDLTQDVLFFSCILKDCTKKLARLPRNRSLSLGVLTTVDEMVHLISGFIDIWKTDIQNAQTHQDILGLYKKKNEIVRLIHELMGLVGQAIVLSHWQSPSIDQSMVDAAGDLRGKIVAHYNDYTRDQHVLGTEFERIYRKEYIRVPRIIPVYAYITVSGMAAMTTAALMILGESPKFAPILLGTSCYFETKQLIKKMFGARVHEVNLTHHDAVNDFVQKYDPVAVFADTIGNEPDMHTLDGSTLIQQMKVSKSKKKYVVLDTSASAHMCAPMSGISLPKGLMLIGVESQNKLLEFGFDRVTAGVVWGTGFEAMRLYDYRDHAGTICPDVLLASLPTPNAHLARLHIRRIERNTKLLVDILRCDTRLKAMHGQVVYPSGEGFCGVYFMLSWQERLFKTFDGYIEKVLHLAKREKVPLIHGTSFGFHTTRIYTVAKNTNYERPFLRIAPGTETEDQIRDIARLFMKAL